MEVNLLRASLPTELLEAIVDELSSVSSDYGFLFACELSDQNSTTQIRVPKTAGRGSKEPASTLFFPQEFLSNRLQSLRFGISKIDFGEILFSGSSLDALCASAVAKSLRELVISQARVHGTGVEATWPKLEALEKLQIAFAQPFPQDYSGYLSSICAHPSLRTLKLTPPARKLKEAICMLLAPSSLPQLRHLHFADNRFSRFDLVIDLVLARPNPSLIEKLCVVASPLRVCEKLPELHRACPNLKTLVALAVSRTKPLGVSVARKMLPMAPTEAIESLAIACDVEPEPSLRVVEADLVLDTLSWLADSFPRLKKSLRLHYVGGKHAQLLSGVLAASHFANLRSLTLDNILPVLVRFPRCLRDLTLSVSSEHDNTFLLEQLNRLCTALISDAPGLVSLLISRNFADFPRRLVHELLLGLPLLKSFRLPMPSRTGPFVQGAEGTASSGSRITTVSEPLGISHPTLEELPLISLPSVSFVFPRWLPKCRTIDLGPSIDTLELLNASLLTGISAASVSLGQEDASGNTRDFAQFCKFLLQLRRRLSSLKVASMAAHRLDASLILKLTSLSHLRLLTNLQLFESDFRQILLQLPRLQELEAEVIVRRQTDLSWIKHSTVSELRLGLNFDVLAIGEEKKRAEGGPNEFPLAFNRETFPSLRFLHLSWPDARTFSPIVVSGLRLLESASLRAGSFRLNALQSPLSVSVSGCPQLFKLCLESFALHQLVLMDVESLQTLTFTDCAPPKAGFDLSQISCPHLISCTPAYNVGPYQAWQNLLQKIGTNAT